ncbi:Aldehyde dehydrogenase OS=Streptomyces antimycoticus OX=68175 GN=SANT12839_056450 PE=4 SV=1 [Streptomyces antimycoticus]
MPPRPTQADVDAAVRAARAAYDDWSRTAPRERAAVLDRVADLLAEHTPDLVPLVQAETGATLRVTSSLQVPPAIDRFRRYARARPRTGHRAARPAAHGRHPAGARRADRSGSGPPSYSVSSPASPPTTFLSRISRARGRPGPGHGQYGRGQTRTAGPAVLSGTRPPAQGGRAPGRCLQCRHRLARGRRRGAGRAPRCRHGQLHRITAVGKKIAESAGRSMKRTLMELGGKGAAIVLGDADERSNPSSAVGAVGSTFSFHSGQICTAPTRVLVHRSLYEKVIAALTHYAESLKIGDPVDNSTIVGPLISAAQRDRVEAYLSGARAQGARIVVGGERPAHKPGFERRPHPHRLRRPRDDRRAGGAVRTGRRGPALRRRGRGGADRRRHPLRPLRLCASAPTRAAP